MRPKKSDKYDEEREKICEKILKILELNENGEFILHNLDTNKEKQRRILDMKEEIQKCFDVCDLGFFRPSYEAKKPYMTIVRSILRKQGYVVKSKDIMFKIEEGLFRRSKVYKIFNNK